MPRLVLGYDSLYRASLHELQDASMSSSSISLNQPHKLVVKAYGRSTFSLIAVPIVSLMPPAFNEDTNKAGVVSIVENFRYSISDFHLLRWRYGNWNISWLSHLK